MHRPRVGRRRSCAPSRRATRRTPGSLGSCGIGSQVHRERAACARRSRAPRRSRCRAAVVGDRRADDDDAVDDDRRRRHRIRRRLERGNSQAVLQVDRPVAAESGARRAVAGVDGEQLRLRRGDEDPAAARGAGRRRLIEPGRTRRGSRNRRRRRRASILGRTPSAPRPVAGSSAMTRPSGVPTYIVPSTTSGVASNAVGCLSRSPDAFRRSDRSMPPRAGPTLSRVICRGW